MKATLYKQNNQDFISTIISFKDIFENSEVLVFGENPLGYQRKPEETHYNKIKKYILEHPSSFIFPTSIVLAADQTDINEVFDKSKGELSIKKDKGKKKIFRIVDGQHRLIALQKASESIKELQNFEFNVIILITNPSKRSIEMEIFYDINSKGKRLKVDLIELARFNYRIIEKRLNEKEINEHISIQTAYFLNESFQNGVWNNAIKFGIHDEHKVGIIGVNAFRESISLIVDSYLKIDEASKYKTMDKEELVNYSYSSAKKIAEFINRAWHEIVKLKWEYCFTEGKTELDLYFEPKTIYYDNRYYIQRTLGTKSINTLIGAIVSGKENQDIKGLTSNSLKYFKEIINECRLTSDDWAAGGLLSGYSSEAGFSKVSKMITGKLPVNR